MDNTKVTKDTENKTLIIEHIVDAPKEIVWRAYADKEWFEKWWGPEGWETTVKQFDFKPGGRVHYCMKCVDERQTDWFGKESWGLMEIESVDEPNGFTAQDNFSDADGNIDSSMPRQKFVIEIVEEGGKTTLINKSVSETVEDMEQLVKMGMIEGFSSQLKRLDQLLA